LIVCEHFIYGLFNGYGYVLTETNGVNKILTKEMREKLCNLKHDEQLLWPPQRPNQDFYISCSKITPTEDEHKRDGVFNSTILISLKDYLTYTNPAKIVQPYFVKKTDKPPKKLKLIEVK